MILVVGLTGGIGSGKSAVADLFQELGVPVIDTDAIAHQLTTAHGAAMPAIRQEFGAELLAGDGALDRAAMRELVFKDPSARKRLEAILHPMIRQESDRRVEHESVASTMGYAILVVPLLIESGTYRERVNRVAVVDCDEEIQVSRVIKRNKHARDKVLRIMSAQATRAQRLAAADDVITNMGDFAQLKQQVGQLHKKYLKSIAPSS